MEVLGGLLGCFGMGNAAITVGGRKFVVKRRLAEGGFSVVDLVTERGTGTDYAMKRVPVSSKREEEAAIKEMKLHREFDHENLLGVVAFGAQTAKNGRREVIAVFPLFTHGTLFDRVCDLAKRGDFMDEHTVLTVFKGVCLGLRAFHTHDPPLAHRDIKLANVLLAADNSPVLMDFGSAAEAHVGIFSRKEAVALQDRCAETCSLPYRAPELVEVASSTQITDRTDIWALGCLLYAMAYHKTPFESITERGGSLPLAIAQGVIQFPESSESRYSDDLKGLIRLMVQLDPSDRPSIDEVLTRVASLAPS